MKKMNRQWRSIVWAIVLGTGALDAAAQSQRLREPSDARLAGLESLYPDDAVTNIASFCSGRMPETRIAWDELLGQWRARNRVQLDELQRLQVRIDDGLRAHPAAGVDLDDWIAIVAVRGDLRAAQMNVLATMTDAQAKRFCDDARAEDADLALDGREMDRARWAAAAALEVLARRR